MPEPMVEPAPAPAVINYPLPALNEVTTRDVNLGSVPSDYTLAARSSREASMNERELEAEYVISFPICPVLELMVDLPSETAPLLGQGRKHASDLDIFGFVLFL